MNIKIIALMLTVALVFSVSACSNDDDNSGIISDTEIDSVLEKTVFETEAETTAEPITEEISESQTEIQVAATTESVATISGLPKLPTVSFTVNDPDNTRGLSTEPVLHGYGVPKNDEPNIMSVNNQEYFDSCGYKAVAYDNKSSEKVLYLTFDCGYENGNTYTILDALKAKNVPAAFFCTLHEIEANPELITRMIKEGHIVGNHSDKHPDFSKISRERMAKEILTVDNYLRTNYGYTSPFFRFPQGNYSENALELVDSMGYTSVFWSSAYVDWDEKNIQGKEYAFNKVTSRLHPGAIILLHSVSQDNAQALGDIIDYARKQGYSFRSLTELTTTS